MMVDETALALLSFGTAVAVKLLRARNRHTYANNTSRRRGRRTRGGPPSKRDRKLRGRFVQIAGYSCSGNVFTSTHPDEAREQRRVECAELLDWLRSHPRLPLGTSIVVSLPDISEIDPAALHDFSSDHSESDCHSLEAQRHSYELWFLDLARRLLAALEEGQFAIFYQSDSHVFDKNDADIAYEHPVESTRAAAQYKPKPKAWCTRLLHKVGLVARAADALGESRCTLLWHKVCTFGPLSATKPQPMSVGRPQCSHMVCYGTRTSPSRGRLNAGTAHYDPGASLSPDVFERGPQL